MKPDWLKFKKYPHIGKPLTKKDTKWIIGYVTDEKKIAKHKFTPLLHKTITQRKFRANSSSKKNPSGKRTRIIKTSKVRPIYYPSHLDSIIYSYYSNELSNAYNDFVKDKGYNSSSVAYRKIRNENGKGNKCNIEFAFEAFKFIEDHKEEKLSMIVSDITSFFDNLDHRILHSKWKEVLKVNDLPDDHYNIYKSLIAKRYVNEIDLYERFKNNLIVERFLKNDRTKIQLKRKSVKKIWYLRKERVKAFCTKKEFFSQAIDLIRKEKPCSHQHQRCRGNCEYRGIPQGTPISATLANIYMIDFDDKVYDICKKRMAFYQRYSDDLIIICNQKDEAYFYNLIQNSVDKLVNLEIQREKTKIYRYQQEENGFTGGIVEDEVVSENKQLEYLGFEYDGSKVRVKTVGFSKFYRSMKRSFRRGIHFASKPENKSHNLFEERLYKRFSYKGAKRRMIWKRDPSSESGYSKTNEQYWGNYISYLNKANHVMKQINEDDTIKNQYSRFWKNFGKEMKKAYQEIGENVSI
ncbi:reverse transcriptase domain-containing protein [Christiangramia crocea]|uniref:Reverse transcriptase domain-containing protein n=1 Tax=Christiangramia crocea TaxID=2904124 RepID=A0A9X2A7M0_9FLAO|nr:reverse transcriptase domain-containing protein [Gramella crocea]MCG9971657.1 hypothetical protein [Gramella crocea]